MPSPSYGWVLLTGVVISGGLYLLCLRYAGLPLRSGVIGILAGGALGLIFAKAGYCLFLAHEVFPLYGLGALFRPNANEFCFVTGCAGACAGAALGARLAHCPAARALDAFALPGAVMVAFARGAEYDLDWIGVGKFVDQSWQQFFPLSVQNEYGDWYTAVFVMEALTALVCAVALGCRRSRAPDGVKFERMAFYLALPQIFWESLRALTMKWGFVRIEQVLCGVLVLMLIGLHCRRYRQKAGAGLAAYFPVAGTLLFIGVIVGMEFALDKSDLSYLTCYGLMIAALAGIAALECVSVARAQKASDGAIRPGGK